MTLKIDVFNHIFPAPFFARLQEVVIDRGAVKRWLHIPFLHDLDVRFRRLEEFGPDYRQILSLSAPPIESINPDRQITIDLAKLANDSMADLARTQADRFPGFIASLPLNYPDESIAELERSITELGALGVQVFSNVNGLPLDDPRFASLFEAADRLRCPILLHPARGARFADYTGEAIWADTAVFGSRAATECGLKFFGTEQVVFASDAPFDPEGGPLYIRETLKIIDSLDIQESERRNIYQGNAERLFNRSFGD